MDLCIKYALAGFTDSINGLWTFLDIQIGDYVSFLYGAKAYNLYVVESKQAILNSEKLPPWSPIKFKQSGKVYCFPFRLQLKPVRRFEESLVKAEFNYIAENLLLRGGHYRTHFQADQTTLQAASQMGVLWNDRVESMMFSEDHIFIPKFSKNRKALSRPKVFRFQELILQAAVRQHLSTGDILQNLLDSTGLDLRADNLEVLGEKVLPEGHVDILIKEAHPMGMARKIILGVKAGVAQRKDIKQIEIYASEIGRECVLGILLTRHISKKLHKEAAEKNVKVLSCCFKDSDLLTKPVSFDELLGSLDITTL